MIILGIDPDSKAHGVAVYVDGALTGLKNMTLVEIIEYIQTNPVGLVSMENAKKHKTVYAKNRGEDKRPLAKIAQNIGENKQSQTELERVFDWLDVPYVLHNPSKTWKKAKDKPMFERITGWTGRSNEDTRSAAWFGYLAK